MKLKLQIDETQTPRKKFKLMILKPQEKNLS
jgi:hypothetical protein